jgi:hypothetical protein
MKHFALLLLAPVLVYAQDTTINYRGQPPTAMAPKTATDTPWSAK